MKKILLTFIALTLGIVSASAQIEKQIEAIKGEVATYRSEIARIVNTIPATQSAREREQIVDDLERRFDDLEEFINRKMDGISATSAVTRMVKQDGFDMFTSPTKALIKFDDFAFSSSPVNYEYYDGDIEIKTTPTRQAVHTQDFSFESTPTRSSFRTHAATEADTLKVREGNRAKVSIVVTDNGFDDSTTVVTYKGGEHFEYKSHNSRHNNHRHDDSSEEYAYIGINNFINADGELDQPGGFMEVRGGRSIEIGVGTTIHTWDLAKFLSLNLGIDYRLNHYSFEQTFNIVKSNGVVTADYDNVPAKNFKRHNLRLQYLSIPLMTEWRIGGGDDPIVIRAGIEGSLRIGAREKQVYKVDGDRKVNRIRSDFETNLLRYSATFGIGFNRYEIYCHYSPVELFKHNHGPELYPISIGFRFLVD